MSLRAEQTEPTEPLTSGGFFSLGLSGISKRSMEEVLRALSSLRLSPRRLLKTAKLPKFNQMNGQNLHMYFGDTRHHARYHKFVLPAQPVRTDASDLPAAFVKKNKLPTQKLGKEDS